MQEKRLETMKILLANKENANAQRLTLSLKDKIKRLINEKK
jgi:hypothetical protein